MSNRRKITPPAFSPDVGPAKLRGEADGTLTILWPKGRPKVVPIPPEALEALVKAHNDAVTAPRPIAAAPAPAPVRRRWWRWTRG